MRHRVGFEYLDDERVHPDGRQFGDDVQFYAPTRVERSERCWLLPEPSRQRCPRDMQIENIDVTVAQNRVPSGGTGVVTAGTPGGTSMA
jgi:hypothetical protein